MYQEAGDINAYTVIPSGLNVSVVLTPINTNKRGDSVTESYVYGYLQAKPYSPIYVSNSWTITQGTSEKANIALTVNWMGRVRREGPFYKDPDGYAFGDMTNESGFRVNLWDYDAGEYFNGGPDFIDVNAETYTFNIPERIMQGETLTFRFEIYALLMGDVSETVLQDITISH
jgi:hypothetical protein